VTDDLWTYLTDSPGVADLLRALAPAGACVRDHPRDGWVLTTLAVPKRKLARACALALAERCGGPADPEADMFVLAVKGGKLAEITAQVRSRCPEGADRGPAA
jgi:hypothetical protein